MTLSLRNAILISGAAINLVLLVLFAAGLYNTFSLFQFHQIPVNPGMLIQPALDNNGDILFMLLLQVLSLITVLTMYVQFRKTASPEIFFFLIFILSLGMEGIRILPATAEVLSLPPFFTTFVVRSLYFSRFLGLFSIFTAGLFANGMQYQKLSIAFGIILLTAFTLASTMPVTESVLKSGAGIYMLNIFNIMLVMLTIQSLSVINFIIAWIRNNNRDYLWLALASLMLISGFELSLRGEGIWYRAAGFGLVCIGTVIFSHRTHEVYLWI